jgi:FKBP-type peptidyl-prolyl cis-trans isomerase FkpA
MKQMLIVVALVIGAAVLTWIIIAGDEGGGLKIIDEKVGTGQEAKAGDLVAVHYTGRLADGTKFDSSLERGEPIVFKLGAGKVIKGWDQGIAGMKEGGKRKLVIPPELGYGAKGSPPVIPPNAELYFDVELVGVQ